jgi:hypothetical protein
VSPQDLASAEALFADGSRLVEAGRYAEACPKLEDARKLVAGIGVALYLGECYEKTGREAHAWSEFHEAELLAAQKADPRRAIAHARAERLWSHLPKMKIVVNGAGGADDLSVARDGEEIDRAAWGIESPVDPGIHHIHASAGGQMWDRSLDVPGDARTVIVIVEIPPPVAPGGAGAAGSPRSEASARPGQTPSGGAISIESRPPVAAPEAPLGGTRWRAPLGVSLGGLAVAGLVVGTVFGIQAKSKQDESNAPGGGCSADDRCTALGQAKRSDALNAATISTVSFVLGGACAFAGAVVFLTAPHERPVAVGVGPRAEGGVSLFVNARW